MTYAYQKCNFEIRTHMNVCHVCMYVHIHVCMYLEGTKVRKSEKLRKSDVFYINCVIHEFKDVLHVES